MPEPISDLVRRSFGITVRSIDLEKRSVDVIASTDSIDAHGEYIDQGSWDLKRYEANPVVLYHHNREGWSEALDPPYTLPIGHAENVRVVKNALEATLCFVDDKASPMAEYVWQGFVQKSLRAVSVGFKPHNVKSEMTDGKDVYQLSDCELFEISVCPMGSNADAVAKTAAKSVEQMKALASRGAATNVTEPPAQEIKPTMDEKQIQALREEHTKALEIERTKASDAAKLVESTKTELATVTTERDTAKTTIKTLEQKLEKANDELIEREVDALIGKKIDPAERAEQLELAKSNKALFDKLIAKRPDMKLGEKAIPPEAKGTGAPVAVNASEELDALVEAASAA